MEYRLHPRSKEKLSVLGFGTGYLRDINPLEIKNIFDYGLEKGMNFIDAIRVEDKFIKPIRESIKEFGDKIYLQAHLTGKFVDGEYKRPRDVKNMMNVFEDDLKAFGVGYADFGLIHSVDDIKDYEKVIENNILDKAFEMKKEGLINHVGVTSHNPDVCAKFIEFDEIDFFMMSCNPSFDYEFQDGELKLTRQRQEFYRKCKKNKIGLSVMKPFSGGRLLNKDLSPLNYALSVNQCIQYCLDRPGVLTVLPGVTSLGELKTSLNYFNASKKDCDYSNIANLTNNHDGDCMYCGHCQPCTNNIPIALINKLYDLSIIGDEIANMHYQKLEHKADECIKCGKCEKDCMFDVGIMKRMDEINNYYQKLIKRL